jgi:hypothetical protein
MHMFCRSPSVGVKLGGTRYKLNQKRIRNSSKAQPQPKPFTPGISRKMVLDHARRLFPDKWPQRHLSRREWLFAERDLVRLIEAEAL